MLRVEEYRKLALELPLAPVAVGLLDRTIERRRRNSATTVPSHSARYRAGRVTEDEPHPGLRPEQLHPAGRVIISGMLAKGCIEKQPDGRTYCITPAGEEALKAIIPV
jgi:hypothetical protein